MKRFILKNKMLLLLFLMFFASTETFSQNYEFAPVGAEWYYTRFYRIESVASGIACDKFTSVGTVIINGIECKEIELYQHLDCHGVVNPHIEQKYVYQDGNLVYEMENNELYLLYDFSKGSGEYWIAPKYNDTIFVRNISYITLDDGTERKVLEVASSNFDWNFYDIIEGVGMTHSLFPHVYLDGSPCIEGPIRCYFENGIQLISSETDCDYEVLSVGEEECQMIVANTLVSDALHVTIPPKMDSQITIKIFDLTGKLVYMTETSGHSIDIPFEDKPVGIYLLHVSSLSDIINIKIVKK